jgi:hypothetical protein
MAAYSKRPDPSDNGIAVTGEIGGGGSSGSIGGATATGRDVTQPATPSVARLAAPAKTARRVSEDIKSILG